MFHRHKAIHRLCCANSKRTWLSPEKAIQNSYVKFPRAKKKKSTFVRLYIHFRALWCFAVGACYHARVLNANTSSDCLHLTVLLRACVAFESVLRTEDFVAQLAEAIFKTFLLWILQHIGSVNIIQEYLLNMPLYFSGILITILCIILIIIVYSWAPGTGQQNNHKNVWLASTVAEVHASITSISVISVIRYARNVDIHIQCAQNAIVWKHELHVQKVVSLAV